MLESFTKDPLFNLIWVRENYATEYSKTFNMSGLSDMTTEDVYNILNIIKASLTSNMTFTKCINYILSENTKGFNSDLLERLSFHLSVQHLLSLRDPTVLDLINTTRDFVAEVAAEKYNILLSEVTEAEKKKLKEDSASVYSITDPPVSGWDEYFFNVCRQAARNSKCLSRRIGAVLVRDNSIISTGYNSPPRGIPSCDKRWTLDKNFISKYTDKITVPLDANKPMCPRHSLGAKSGELLDICPAGHAEENAILNAAWHGISTKGATLFMTCGIPCFRCIIKIINAGISEIVVTGVSFYDDNAEFLLNNSEVKVRFYNFNKKT